MVGSSKILTVSYGTFSCTLEGFEDPFSTMRSIAEYFRDLAADDRYFGAEPPTPDAEMLHRIAQREVRHRVEAHVSETGIVLSQSDDAADEDAPAEARADAPPAPRDRTDTPETTSADKLDRIRAVVERARSRPASASAWRTPSERVTGLAGAGMAATAEGGATDHVILPFDTYGAPEPEDLDFGDDDLDAADIADDVEGPDSGEALEHDAAEGLAGIESSDTEDADAAAWTGTPMAADETGDAPRDTGDEGWSDDLDTDTEDDDAMDAADLSDRDDVTDENEEDTPEAPVAKSQEDGSDDADTGETDTADATAEPEPEEDLAERIIRLSRAGEASSLISDDDADNAAGAPDALAPGLHRTLSPEARAETPERKDQRPGRGHVLIGRDPDREPAFKRILEETNSKMADREGTRRRSAIAHLKAAVQATKADRMLKRERSRQVDAEEQSAYRDDLAKVVRPHTSEPAEVAAARIVAEARAEDEEPSPLVLMSSQRVDPRTAAGDEAQDAPQEAAGPETEGADEIEAMYSDDYDAFARFAADAGATEIIDLLEAAAAFTAFVGDQAYFSRPQIMRLAAAASSEEDFTREAGLRAFGQLLRQGRIQKLQRGQFAVSGSTRFRPGARIAGE